METITVPFLVIYNVIYSFRNQSNRKYITGTRQTKGQLRADVATHMDMFIQKNNVQTPINDLWPEFSGTINLLQTKYVPSKLHLKHKMLISLLNQY